MLKKNTYISESPDGRYYYKLLKQQNNLSPSELSQAELFKQNCPNISNNQLVNELYDLLSHEDVRKNMDEKLRNRIDRILNHVESLQNEEQYTTQQNGQEAKYAIDNLYRIFQMEAKQKCSRTTTANQTQLINLDRKNCINEKNEETSKKGVDSQHLFLPKYQDLHDNTLSKNKLNSKQYIRQNTKVQKNYQKSHKNDGKVSRNHKQFKDTSCNKENKGLIKNGSSTSLKKNKISTFKVTEKPKKSISREKTIMAKNSSKINLKILPPEIRSNATSKSKEKKSRVNSRAQSPYPLSKGKIGIYQDEEKEYSKKIGKSHSQKNFKKYPLSQFNQTLNQKKDGKRQKFYTQACDSDPKSYNPHSSNRVCTQANQLPQNLDQNDFSQEDSYEISENEIQCNLEGKIPTNNGIALKMLAVIYQKQEQIIEEKREFQEKVQKLRDMVSSQRMILQQKNNEVACMTKQIEKMQGSSLGMKDKKLETHRKLEEIWSEVKKVNSVLQGMRVQNEQVNLNITQEKQLITMYQTVIEELKIQLKIEKNERDEIRKNLNRSKKTKQVHRMKSNTAGKKTGQMIHSVMKSMEKWM